MGPIIKSIVNGDGTMFDPPKNPLKEKWEKLYPPTPMPQYSQVCDGYSCMYCDRCPNGELWKCPAEDIEAYESYQSSVRDYIFAHNFQCE